MLACLHPIGGNFVAPGNTWNFWSSKHINPEIAARQHLEWQELTREGHGPETESLTGLTGGLANNKKNTAPNGGPVGVFFGVKFNWGGAGWGRGGCFLKFLEGFKHVPPNIGKSLKRQVSLYCMFCMYCISKQKI